MTGVQKAPRHEVAGSCAPAGQRTLWGFDVSAEADGGGTLPGSDRDVWTGEVGSLQRASRQALGAHQRALGALIAVLGSREITAGKRRRSSATSKPNARSCAFIAAASTRKYVRRCMRGGLPGSGSKTIGPPPSPACRRGDKPWATRCCVVNHVHIDLDTNVSRRVHRHAGCAASAGLLREETSTK